MACEQCEGIELQFGRSAARKKLRQFRRRGPDKTTRLLVDALRATLDGTDTRGVVLLDIGAGVGAIHHELLDGHVERAIHVDGSTAHLAAARDEAERRGHGPRVEFVHGDFVDLAGAIPAAARRHIHAVDRETFDCLTQRSLPVLKHRIQLQLACGR